MPEIREDYATPTWVVFSAARSQRPGAFRNPKDATAKESCPFCEGHETMTPPEVLAYRDRGKPDGPGWSIRCVPNKFPALERVGEVREHWDGPFVSVDGVGAHEIVVESPDHDAHLARTPSSGRASACFAKSSDASWPPVAASSPRTEGSSRSSRMRRASRSRRGSSRKSTRVRSRPSRMRTWGTRADSERRPRSNGSGARRSVLQLLHSHRTGPGARGQVPFGIWRSRPASRRLRASNEVPGSTSIRSCPRMRRPS